jgi:hypothetical protein
MQTLGAKHMLADQLGQRCQDSGRRADQIGERRQVDLDTFSGVAHGRFLLVQRVGA